MGKPSKKDILVRATAGFTVAAAAVLNSGCATHGHKNDSAKTPDITERAPQSLPEGPFQTQTGKDGCKTIISKETGQAVLTYCPR